MNQHHARFRLLCRREENGVNFGFYALEELYSLFNSQTFIVAMEGLRHPQSSTSRRF
jgi:hypothetical protein